MEILYKGVSKHRGAFYIVEVIRLEQMLKDYRSSLQRITDRIQQLRECEQTDAVVRRVTLLGEVVEELEQAIREIERYANDTGN